MNLPIIVLGAGGHAKVLIDALLAVSAVIVGVGDIDPALVGTSILGVPVLGGDEVVNEYSAAEIQLVNGLGSVGLPLKRQQIYERFKSKGYSFATVVHPSAVIASGVTLGEGAQIMAGAVIQTGSSIGSNSIVNTRASVDHDCSIGDHVHVAPGVTLSGGVTIGSAAHIGTGTTVIQGVLIGEGVLVGAGSLVIKDVPSGVTCFGSPVKI